MAEIKHFKVVASLPSPLEPDSIYYVRVGRGYDQYVTNGVGVIVAYEANSKLDLENKVDKEDGKQLSDENYTLAEKTKLSGIQAGATANATNAQLRDRSTHTGTQAISTVSGLQTALDSKVDDDDARLTNAREWTASLVSQAEAEAGTATTARKWTAQRVRQAIVAWFNGVSGALGRTILTRTTAAQVRSDIGLGTAATKDVGEESGQVMEVGAFGLGNFSIPNTIADDKDIRELASGIYSLNRTHFQNIADDGAVLWVGMRVNSNGTFILHQASSNKMWISTRFSNQSGEISWAEIFHTGNFNPDTKANTSTQVIAGTGLSGGGTLAANRTLSVVYGTTAGTAAQGNDSRLSDSREWTASTVTQAEAEAGTATTRRAWTAQRVKQAFDAAWAAAKAALLDTQNTWSKPQIIRQGIANTALELSIPTAHIVAIKFGSGVDTENPRNIYFGVRADGTLATGPTATLAYAIHTTNTLPIRSANNVLNYIGNGVTLAEDERAALELGPPVTSANANLLPGRNRNITVSGSRTVTGLSQHFGKGAFASMTIRSNSTASRTITLGGTILNRTDYDEQYVVTNTNVLYLEGRYVEHGFIVTYLTMYTIPT